MHEGMQVQERVRFPGSCNIRIGITPVGQYVVAVSANILSCDVSLTRCFLFCLVSDFSESISFSCGPDRGAYSEIGCET